MTSLRKFFKFLRKSERTEKEVEDDVRETLKESKDKFFEAVEFDDAYW